MTETIKLIIYVGVMMMLLITTIVSLSYAVGLPTRTVATPCVQSTITYVGLECTKEVTVQEYVVLQNTLLWLAVITAMSAILLLIPIATVAGDERK